MNWISFSSDNGLSPVRCQAITWTNTNLLSTGPLGTNFQWNPKQNTKLFNHENAFEVIVWEIAAILFMGSWGNFSTKPTLYRAANRYGISVFCTEFTCKIREYEFGLQNTEIELCQFCHIKYCCQNKAYLFWVANQSRFVAFYALKPSNTSLITKTFNLLSSTCSSSTFSCLTSCSCSTERIH